MNKHCSRICFFSGKLNDRSHKTFRKKDGNDYFEGHHFIPQAKRNKVDGDLSSVVDDPENLITLCSNCHNQLHYGEPEKISEMIDMLWRDETIHNMLVKHNFQEIIKAKSEEDALKWVKEAYDSDIGQDEKIVF